MIMAIGKRIKYFRNLIGLTQKELGALSDRNRIMQKKDLEAVNARWNEYLNRGYDGENESPMAILFYDLPVFHSDDSQPCKGNLTQFSQVGIRSSDTVVPGQCVSVRAILTAEYAP